MSRALYVAAGGGGDALAALIARDAIDDGDATPIVASYSWDRYLIDPAAGPRSPSDFQNLNRLTEHSWEVTGHSHLTAGGISGLTLLARSTPARFVLLDPRGGAVGLRHQLRELVEHLSADRIVLVDVGGDVAAHGDEPTLLSPLADSLALAALADQRVPAAVAVLGPGLDGELPDADVRRTLTTAGATPVPLAAAHVDPYVRALEHHPSEATTLVAAAAMGVSGRAEIRDRATLVPVTEASATMFLASADALLTGNAVAAKLIGTRSFEEAEAATAAVCGHTELTHERRKAEANAGDQQVALSHDELNNRFEQYLKDAHRRGVTLVSFRRLTEVLGRRSYEPTAMRILVGELAHERLPLCRIGPCH